MPPYCCTRSRCFVLWFRGVLGSLCVCRAGQTREEILKVSMAQNRVDASVNFTAITAELEGFTGSDIKEVRLPKRHCFCFCYCTLWRVCGPFAIRRRAAALERYVDVGVRF